MKQSLILVGTQWGDEGKGKIVDYFSQKFDAVCRFQGGHNAGHTLVIDKKKPMKKTGIALLIAQFLLINFIIFLLYLP